MISQPEHSLAAEFSPMPSGRRYAVRFSRTNYFTLGVHCGSFCKLSLPHVPGSFFTLLNVSFDLTLLWVGCLWTRTATSGPLRDK